MLKHVTFLFSLLCSNVVQAHTWIDCIDTDRSVVYDGSRQYIYGGSSANGMCAGYMKDYPGRGDANINTEMTFKILMADVAKSAPLCTADAWDYSGWRHRLSVSVGQPFYYGYLPNGHVAKDQAARGTYYGVYWTGTPGTSLDTTPDLSSDKLIDGQLHDFDDGNCGETYTDLAGTIPSGRAGDGYPCMGSVTMPAGTAAGIYNLVWFWKFYNAEVNSTIKTTGGSYGGAAYTSCFQVEVTAGTAEDVTLTPSATTGTPTTAPEATSATPSATTSTPMTTSPTTADPETTTPSTMTPEATDATYSPQKQ
ncbi:hypothetical protein BBJ28_00006082 [Nothophytophthora sp. Chile5]|nr:hypothetical protein BBJ28_00006082 [Nothophytophthora sp. Chile5]